MIEAYAASARALAVLTSAHLIGVTLFLLMAGAAPASASLGAWSRGFRRSLPIAAIVLCIALFALLHAQACSVAGGFAPMDLMAQLARETVYGRWWCLRALAASFAVLAAFAVAASGDRLRVATLITTTLAAAATSLLAPLTGHAASLEQAQLLMPLHMAHLLALSAWLGALPAWIGLARRGALDADPEVRAFAAGALERFSRWAMPGMAVIVITGVVLAYPFLDDQGDLLGTRYGLLLCAKLILLALVLRIADGLRRRLLPQLRTQAAQTAFADGATRVRHEWLIALGLLCLGAGLAQTIPAVHDQPHWWLPVRLSFDAGWADPATRTAIWLGAALIIFAATLIAATRRSRPLRALVPAIAIAGLAVAMWGLSVKAFPDTFLRPPVPYLSLSIDQGRDAFETSGCTACHGAGGLGDGALAATMRKPPANLSEPHTALHTPGDMFWWFTHGMPAGPMPGYGDVLDEEQRWDLVNFLRAFSQGFQARVLGPRIVPGKPWLGAPDFYYEMRDGGSAQLKDLRGVLPALLVFTDVDEPRSVARLGTLQRERNTAFVVIAPRSEDVWLAYQFLTRTLVDRGAPDRLGMPRRHVEFLIDRFGYIRARWIPTDDPEPWSTSFDVQTEVARLADEPQILPPPDLHLH